MKNLLIDARLYGLEHAGIGRYVKGLVEHLPQDPEISISIITHPSHANEKSFSRFKVIPAKHHPYSYSSQIELLKILYQEKPDLLHFPHFTISPLWMGKMVVTIHDLIKHESRGLETTTKNGLFYWPKYFQYLAIVRLAIRRSSRVFVPSNYWKERLIEKYNVAPNKIIVTYEGVDRVFFGKGKKPNIKIKTPYIIYVGNVYPHKNVDTIIKAVKILDGKVHLYISCARSVFWERTKQMIKKLNAEDFVTHLGFAPDEELVYLYKNSLAFVTASKIEGLGLPGLEAMASGAPVISSDASCLPEVYGNAAEYFPPNNTKELVNKIELLMGNNALRRELIAKGKKQVIKYGWEKMATKTWQAYKQILSK